MLSQSASCPPPGGRTTLAAAALKEYGALRRTVHAARYGTH
ncbi:hypothetical protein ACIBEK_07100 [Nocardia fusca]